MVTVFVLLCPLVPEVDLHCRLKFELALPDIPALCSVGKVVREGGYEYIFWQEFIEIYHVDQLQ